MEILREKREFKAKSLAARQCISPPVSEIVLLEKTLRPKTFSSVSSPYLQGFSIEVALNKAQKPEGVPSKSQQRVRSGVMRDLFSVDVSDTFYFFCSGEGKAESDAPGGGGGRFLMKNARRGGVCQERGRGGGGREGPGGCLWGIWGGGGLNIFFGAEMPTQF